MIYKMTFSLCTTLALCASLTAAASDLSDDLRTPFEPVTNPFGQAASQPLSVKEGAALKALLEQCAYVPVSARSPLTVLGEARLRAGCEERLQATYEQDRHGATVLGRRLDVKALGLVVVSWDGSDSDGGDQQALGVYDESGKRLAIYTGVFADGDVVDGLARVAGAALPQVEE